MAGQDAAAVQRMAQCHQQAKQQTNREKDQVQRSDAGPVVLQVEHPYLGSFCVVNVMRPYPASLAASITLITDWCGALASALMTMVGSVCSPAAFFRELANSATPV